jgi:arginine decarboxylase-like protein
MSYTIEDLFQSVNDLYSQYDMGKIDLKTAEFLTKFCCHTFIDYLDKKEKNEL